MTKFKTAVLGYILVMALTWYRLLMSPVLIALAFSGNLFLFKWLLAASFLTDALDGFLSRLFKTETPFGAKLDSIADDCNIIAAITGVCFFSPGFLLNQYYAISVMIFLFLMQSLFSLLKYGRLSSFHTYGAKCAAVFQAAFLIALFFFKPIPVLFHAMVLLTNLELMEEIILVLILPQYSINVKGLYWILKARKERPIA